MKKVSVEKKLPSIKYMLTMPLFLLHNFSRIQCQTSLQIKQIEICACNLSQAETGVCAESYTIHLLCQEKLPPQTGIWFGNHLGKAVPH